MSLLGWKFRRELHRIRQQLQGIPEFFTEPARRRRHDAQRVAMLDAPAGAIGLQRKIALLLVFQPKGVSDATRWTCEHLVKKGYAPLVISNAPLTVADRALLRPWVWKMTERPNFGYDFGGYRDGIWMLQQWGIDPDALIILNDSIWFPLQGTETLIDQMEANPADFVGALQLDPLRQTNDLPKKKRPFFGSFFLMIKHAAWTHPAFQTFWARYLITSNKYKTIRRGERGFSHALMDGGIRSDAIYKRSDLDRHIHELPDDALRNLLGDLVTIDERIEADIAAAVSENAATPGWRARALSLAMKATEKQNILATAPIASMTVFQVPYLKKSLDWNNRKALKLLWERMNSHSLPPAHNSILDDMRRVVDAA
jgi:hypothetical protein